MEKYDFNKEITVSVSIIESDDVEESEQHLHNRNNENIITTDVIDIETRQETTGSNQITSVYFESAHKDYELNDNHSNERLNFNNNLVSPQFSNESAGIHNNSQTNTDSWVKDLLVPQDKNLSLRPLSSRTISTSSTESTTRTLKIYYELKSLAMNIIYILKAYNYYQRILIKCGNSELLRNKCNEDYKRAKERYFHACIDVAVRIVLPMGDKFNRLDFINKTISIAKAEEKLICTYENVHRVFSEIIGSCYKPLSSQEVYHKSTNGTNNGHNLSLQNDFQNHGHSNNIAHTIHNGHQPISQQNCQNYLHSNNLVQTGNNGHNNGHYDIVTLNNRHKSLVQQDSQNNWHSSNLTQAVNNGTNFRNDGHHNVAQTNYKGPSSVLQQISKNERQRSNVAKPTNNELNSVLQDLILYDEYYNYVNKTNNREQNSISNPNYKNVAISPQSNSHKRTNAIYKQNLENSQNYGNKPLNSSDQKISEVPSVCVFEYSCPKYEVRFHLNTQLLNDANSSNQVNNCTDDPSPAKKQCMSNDVRQPWQSTEPLNAPTNEMTCQDVSPILQEPTRSTSRESHFMSPCNMAINDVCNGGEVQDPTVPYITTVTSLNPKAKQIPAGPCHVCGQATKKKCLGCFKYYYCTTECQKYHWSIHKFDCGHKGHT